MTPAQQAETIKPCPFCGKAEDVGKHNWDGVLVVQCEYCGASGPLCDAASKAIQEWNTRHPESAPEPSTTLPTEPGLYWWRGEEGEQWILIKVWIDDDKDTIFEIISKESHRQGEMLIGHWEAHMGIGQWLPITPPESEVKG